MKTTIFVALGRHSISKAAANAAVTYKYIINWRGVDIRVSTRDQMPNSDDEGSYRFRTVTTTTGEESS